MKMLKMCLQPKNVPPFPDLSREDIVPETVLFTVAAPLSSSDLLSVNILPQAVSSFAKVLSVSDVPPEDTAPETVQFTDVTIPLSSPGRSLHIPSSAEVLSVSNVPPEDTALETAQSTGEATTCGNKDNS